MEPDFKPPNGYAFEVLIQAIVPGARGAELVALFERRLSPQKICDYRKGRRYPPQWAADLLRDKLARKHARELVASAQIKTGPGKRAGAINIKKWNAANPR